MLKKLHVLLLVLLAAVCFTATAWADYDYIEQYGVMVTPNTEDGSLLITVKLEWTPLEELPYGQELKIGVPNGSIRDVAAQTDNIERLDFDNSYMYVYLTQGYDKDETFSFAYSWVQEYMYQLDGSAVTYDYTPGWFDEARIGQMTLIWNDPAGLTGDFTEGTVSGADSVTVQNGMTITASDLDYGYKMNIQVRYTDWPTQLSEEYSADNLPSDYDHCVYVPCEHFEDDTGDAIIGMMVTIFVVIFILVLISAARRGSGYAGGFGTRYVFVNHLWYPPGRTAGPVPAAWAPRRSPDRPEAAAGASAGAAGAAALAEAVSAAAATAPAPAAAPVRAPVPVPAAAAPAARPRTSTAWAWTKHCPKSSDTKNIPRPGDVFCLRVLETSARLLELRHTFVKAGEGRVLEGQGVLGAHLPQQPLAQRRVQRQQRAD